MNAYFIYSSLFWFGLKKVVLFSLAPYHVVELLFVANLVNFIFKDLI